MSGIDADVGIAIVAGGGAQPRTLGDWAGGVAWSTIKVPLAIAALRAAGDGATSAVTAAITQSDNEAAERLWSMLGEPVTAAEAVQGVLREGHDDVTVVQSDRVRPPFSAFGQTEWGIREQAEFAAHLRCIPDSGRVVEDMRNVVAGQRWGLASVDDAAAKAGWGPGTDGRYLLRQLGLLPGPDGWTAVALATVPSDGSFDTGVQIMDRLTEWLLAHRAALPSGSC